MDRNDYEKLAERLINSDLDAQTIARELGFNEETDELTAGLNEWCELYECSQCLFWLPADNVGENMICFECLDANRHG